MLELGRDFLRRHDVPGARRDAELLVAHALGLERLQLFLQLDRPVSGEEIDRARELLVRRSKREPVAYVTGVREFYGRPFRVDRSVLVPRPETELLVDVARARLAPRAEAANPPPDDAPTPGVTSEPGGSPEPVEASAPAAGAHADDAPGRGDAAAEGPAVADLGTGSGCLAVTLALELPGARVVASDVSAAALEVARGNAERLGAAVAFVEGDGPAALEPARAGVPAWDLLVCNPPYVDPAERAELEPDVRDHEPAGALFAPAGDPDHWVRRLLDEALPWLAPGGALLVELGAGQGPRVLALARERGLAARLHPDLAGIPRVLEVSAPRPGA